MEFWKGFVVFLQIKINKIMKTRILIIVPFLVSLLFFACNKDNNGGDNPHNLRGSSFSNLDTDTTQILFDNKDRIFTQIQTVNQVTKTTGSGKYKLKYPSIKFTYKEGDKKGSEVAATFRNDDTLIIDSRVYVRN